MDSGTEREGRMPARARSERAGAHLSPRGGADQILKAEFSRKRGPGGPWLRALPGTRGVSPAARTDVDPASPARVASGDGSLAGPAGVALGRGGRGRALDLAAVHRAVEGRARCRLVRAAAAPRAALRGVGAGRGRDEQGDDERQRKRGGRQPRDGSASGHSLTICHPRPADAKGSFSRGAATARGRARSSAGRTPGRRRPRACPRWRIPGPPARSCRVPRPRS